MTILIEDNAIVTPGDLLAEGNYEVGDGVYKSGEHYYAKAIGVFSVKNEKLRVRVLKGRYYPKVGDKVIGYIEDCNLTSWIVNIRGPYSGVLLASNAIKGRFDPIKDDTRRIFDVGDVIRAEIISFDRTRDPMLATKYSRLGKLEGGRVIEVSPNHIPRIIGSKGSMIQMIKNKTNTRITVAQNGRVWIRGDNPQDEARVIEVIERITREAHTSGLTDRIESLLDQKEN
jgi:exosome complex component RRP4